MLKDKRILALVPARSGSTGIKHKNMRKLAGATLIELAARALAPLEWLDERLISTDSAEYEAEGNRHGLKSFGLRPDHLSSATAPILDTLDFELCRAEQENGVQYDVVLLAEPTSPFRTSEDMSELVRTLLDADADSAVAVSVLPSKSHPRKVLKVEDGRLGFFATDGNSVSGRQQLLDLYWRNGVGYALTRSCILRQRAIFGAHTVPVVIEHPVINIDEEWELDWAEFMIQRGMAEVPVACH